MAKSSKTQEEAQIQEDAQAENAVPSAPETAESTQSAETASAADAEAPKTLKPTAGAGELASPRMDSPLERVEDLATLADRHRIASWQQAALCRLMGWEDGKMVTSAEYMDGLDRLKTRRLGGGHKG